MELNSTLLFWYLLFTFTTAICAYLELFAPVLRELKVLNPSDMLVNSPWLTRLVLVSMAALTAPIILAPCLIPSWGERFRSKLLEGLQG